MCGYDVRDFEWARCYRYENSPVASESSSSCAVAASREVKPTRSNNINDYAEHD